MKVVVSLLLSAALFCGCASTRPKRISGSEYQQKTQGWRAIYDRDITGLDAKLVADFKQFVAEIPEAERMQLMDPHGKLAESRFHFAASTNGQHSVSFQISRPPFIGWSETIWTYVVIYDENNNRLEAVRFKSGSSIAGF